MFTYDLSEQDNVLAADEEQTDPLFRKHLLVIYPLDRIFQNQIGCKAGSGRTQAPSKERNAFVFRSLVKEVDARMRTELIIRSQDPKQLPSIAKDDQHLSCLAGAM